VQILNGTALGDGITLTYYSSSSSDNEEDDSVKGTATKRQKAKTDQAEDADIQLNNEDDISWFVVLANGQTFEVVEDDLKNADQYKVHLPTNNQFACVAENKKRKQQRQLRQRKLQAEKEERFVVEEAHKEMTSFWKDQWQELAAICENPDRSLGWEECAAIFKKVAEPYKTKINGRDVTVNASNSAVFMRDISLSRFADTILKQEENDEQEDGQFAQSMRPRKKQKNTNNSATVNTTLGADGYSALSQTQRRDTEYINKKDANSSKKTAERIKWIDTTLTLVSKHKDRCEKNKRSLMVLNPGMEPPNCLQYFEFDEEQTNKDSRIAILRLLAPDAKVLSKAKDVQCQLILQQIVPSLCKELFDNKESCLRMELASLNHVSGGEQRGEADGTMM